MLRILFLFSFLPLVALSQVRIGKLELQRGQTFQLPEGDILVVDTLIMRDSSVIQLNRKVNENYLHARYFQGGKGIRISGVGESGKRGKDGAKGLTPDGPCLDGAFGRGGTGGTHGDNGVNLFMYLTTFALEGTLYVELNGGEGGDGGNGGEGGGGGTGTRVCVGGDGGVGGNGGTGGNGGAGGTLTINCKQCPDLRSWLNEKLFVRNFGGFAGLGGSAGQGGHAGLGVDGDNSKDGKNGSKGKAGANGEAGKPGAINFDYN